MDLLDPELQNQSRQERVDQSAPPKAQAADMEQQGQAGQPGSLRKVPSVPHVTGSV